MSYLFALPEAMSAAATNVASIGSAVATAGQSAAGATTGVLAAAEDEVSAAIATWFSGHGESYQALSAEVEAFQERFLQTLSGATGAYAATEVASAAPLAAFEGVALSIQQLPATMATGFAGFLQSPGAPIVESFLAWPPFRSLFASEIPPLSWFLGNQPPPLLNSLLGQTVSYSSYEGMSVVQITPAHPTGEYVVALHGGGYVLPVSILHWVNYSVTAYATGATFQVPIYPLVQEGGTAGVVVPKVANYISSQIALHGAPNVSVIGDSAGGNLALSAVQYMVAQGNPVPSALVLESPWLDLQFGQQVGRVWAGGLPLNNYLVSPLYGSLNGLPPTYVYSGALDPLASQAAVLQQQATAHGAPVHFLLDYLGFHDWVLGPTGFPYFPLINSNLGIAA